MPLKRLLLAMAIVTAACSTSFSPGEPLVGTWGGDGASAELNSTGGHILFVCADGTLDAPLVPNSSGRVNSTGVSSLVGGPARPNDYVPESHPVRYAGKVDGSTLTLTVIRTDVGSAEPAGPFVLHRGELGEVNGCPLAAPH